MTLNEELLKFREEFLLKHNISCSTCELWEKNRKGKCASKVYCIVRDKALNCAYRPRKTTFRKDWKVFFCTHCGKTFTVSYTEYQLAYEAYTTALEESKKLCRGRNIPLSVRFELKGHTEWIYRLDEDYTEELKKYESINSKS